MDSASWSMYETLMISWKRAVFSLSKLSLLLCLLGFALIANAAISGINLLTDQATDVLAGKKGTVVVFLSAKCPCSNSHVQILKKLAGEFKDFSFVAVHANADEATELSKVYFKTADFSFPVIQDNGGRLADEFKALKTPHAFLLGADGKILYKGGVTSSHNGSTADRQFLRDALIDVAAGRTVKVAEGRTLGCMISRGRK